MIIRNISYLVRDAQHIDSGLDVRIEGSRISEIGPNLITPPGADEIDAAGCAVIPGLVNAHTHLYQNFLKGVSQGVTLVPWCNEVLFPTVGAIRNAFARGNYRPAYLWSALAAIEMIRGGTTCCLDMDVTAPQSLEAWRDIGFRGVAGYTLANKWVPAELRGEDMELRRKVEAFITEWHRPEGRIQVFLAPSTLFLCDDGLLTWSRDRAEELDLGIQIHISEIAGEVEDSLKEWNRTPVERLVDLGLLTPRLSAVHCVHVNNAEIDCMAKAGVTIVHCPKSNMKLADGIAPVVSMQKAGLRIGLGTDGCGSNDLLDMWEEMRAAVFLARVSTKQADALSAADVFRMATLDAAHTCRIEAGQIRVGCLADLAIVELKSAHLRPFHADRLLDMLVFCGRAGDVRDTIIAGEVVMRNRCITRLAEGDLLQEADVIEAALYADRSEFIF